MATLAIAALPCFAAPAPPSPAGAGDERAAAGIGDVAPRFHLVDTSFLPRALDELEGRSAYVLVFSTIDCPIAKRYAPVVAAMERELRDRGVQFLLVNVGPYDSLIDAAGLAIEQGVAFPVLKDLRGEAASALGATRTPEAVVLDADRVIRYRGRIDDGYRLGGTRVEPARHDLRVAIEQVLAGEPVAVPVTPVDGCLIPAFSDQPSRKVDFDEVRPILRQSCTPCHGRDLQAAPFPLLTYEDAARRAEMIAEVVELRRMPPWFADARHGTWSNDPRLSDDEVRTILDWVRSGTPPGTDEAEEEPPAAPAASAAEPGLVLHTREVALPATGIVPYEFLYLLDESTGEPYAFPEDTWVSRVETIPSNRKVVHHVRMQYRLPGGEPEWVGGYIPGTPAAEFPPGDALLVPRGAQLVLVTHLVTTGMPEKVSLGAAFTFASGKVERRIRTLNLGAPFSFGKRELEIPPGDPSFVRIDRRELPVDARGIGLWAHMHLRGKAMRFAQVGGEAGKQPLLLIPNYNFDWQLIYYWDPAHAPILPAGSQIECTAVWDNSSFNALNPDPTALVGRGPQTEDEMMVGMLLYVDENEALDLEVDPKTGRASL